MAALKSEHKEFIVKGLATCDSVTEIQRELKQVYDVDASMPQILYYDPDKSGKLAKKWRHMYYETRRRYMEEVSVIPIANKGYRLNEMQKNYEKAKRSGNLVLAQQILEQASKEVGGLFERGMAEPVKEGNFYQQINNIIIQKDGN